MVYLIHFDEQFGHARHYCGYSADQKFLSRLARHRAGNGANLLRRVNEAGITWRVVRCWPGWTRGEERRLKRQGGLSRHCPVCRASGTFHR